MATVRHIAGGQFSIGGRYVGTDWEYPSAATGLGWSIRRVQKRGNKTVTLSRVVPGKLNCRHSSTDGTVTCKECGVTASEFIAAAGEFLHERAE